MSAQEHAYEKSLPLPIGVATSLLCLELCATWMQALTLMVQENVVPEPSPGESTHLQ